MKYQNQTASEVNNSSSASTAAHETCKRNFSGLFLCLIAAVAMSFSSCSKDKDGDDNKDDNGGAFDGVITAQVGNDGVDVKKVYGISANGGMRWTVDYSFENGAFTITLPSQIEQNDLWNIKNTISRLTGSLNGSSILDGNYGSQTFIFKGFTALNAFNDEFNFYYAKETDSESTCLVYLYSNKNEKVQESGTTERGGEWKCNLNLKKGWNKVYYTLKKTGNWYTSGLEFTSNEVSGLSWLFVGYDLN